MASTDRDALGALFRSTGGVNWKKKDNWVTGAELSRWHGGTLNDQGRVMSLSLSNNKLQGIWWLSQDQSKSIFSPYVRLVEIFSLWRLLGARDKTSGDGGQFFEILNFAKKFALQKKPSTNGYMPRPHLTPAALTRQHMYITHHPQRHTPAKSTQNTQGLVCWCDSFVGVWRWEVVGGNLKCKKCKPIETQTANRRFRLPVCDC